MPDIYVDVGPMGYSRDPKKVATKVAGKAKKLMRDGAMKAIRSALGFTPEKTGNPTGYHLDATLTEVTFGTYQGQPSVTCKVNGLVATYPDKKMLTQKLTGSATTVGGTSDGDIEDCIKTVMEETTKGKVLPFLKAHAKS